MRFFERWSKRVDADGLRETLLHDRSPSVRRRQWIARLAAAGLVDAAAMALHQMGAVKKLPDLPLRGFDSNKVVSSRAAYVLGVPDATLGALQYSMTMITASLVQRRRLSSLLLGVVVAAGAVGAAAYLRDMVVKEQKACMYCIPALLINFAMVPLAAAELVAGRRRPRQVGRGGRR
jgi:uncharacterized membrane protein